MVAALLFAAICLKHAGASTCVSRDVIADVGQQLLDRVFFADTRDLEPAAFLTMKPDGSLGCFLWPATNERDASTFHGDLPADTVAVVHTHPREWQDPSAQDSLLSRELDISVVVVTHGFIVDVDPAGAISRRTLYGKPTSDAPICRAVTANLPRVARAFQPAPRVGGSAR
ncbi:MAG TPA: hypothetical protein VGQ44_20955 [Gemmatimonadaceae bacterium]|jgi:hypothetical protein|nr:hypothetical protein [Gemmatimonadaceae bacterium]